jgi:hypothetical protein
MVIVSISHLFQNSSRLQNPLKVWNYEGFLLFDICFLEIQVSVIFLILVEVRVMYIGKIPYLLIVYQYDDLLSDTLFNDTIITQLRNYPSFQV